MVKKLRMNHQAVNMGQNSDGIVSSNENRPVASQAQVSNFSDHIGTIRSEKNVVLNTDQTTIGHHNKIEHEFSS